MADALKIEMGPTTGTLMQDVTVDGRPVGERPGTWTCERCRDAPTPAEAKRAATTWGDERETPLAAARRELEELMPVERSNMPTIVDLAIDKLVIAASAEREACGSMRRCPVADHDKLSAERQLAR